MLRRAPSKRKEDSLSRGPGFFDLRVVNLNTANFLAERCDAVYAHACLHHVFQLEHLLEQVNHTLTAGGLFVVREYIGPSHMQFPQKHLYLTDVFLKTIPECYRRMHRQKGIKHEAPRLSLQVMNSSDPSGSIRASEIVPAALKLSISVTLAEHPYS
jgi:SAM-dependent methyltransferase